MPREEFGKSHNFLPKNAILTYEEISNFVRACKPLGLRKVRITGGEPLLRQDIHHLVRQLSSMEMEVALTTNGSLLEKNAVYLAESGLSRVTISLDAIDQDVHSSITDSQVPVTDILDGISAAVRYEMGPVKVNCVVQRGVNEDQIPKLVRKFRGTGVIVRFIEFMDVGNTNGWTQGQVVPTSEIIDFLSSEFDLNPLPRQSTSDVATRWAHSDGSGEIGFISSVSQPFCGDCVRARLSSDGQFFTCLFTTNGHDMSSLIRSDRGMADLSHSVEEVWSARKDRYSEERSSSAISLPRVEMSYIGG